MIELDFYILYVFSMELRSFEKPYVALLNSSNWATGGPIEEKLSPPLNTFQFPPTSTTKITFSLLLRILFFIVIPPLLRKLYNHLLYTLSLKYYFFFTFLVIFVKSEKCVPTNLCAIHKSKFSVKHLFFFNFHYPT
jgi:hypothetical protein